MGQAVQYSILLRDDRIQGAGMVVREQLDGLVGQCNLMV